MIYYLISFKSDQQESISLGARGAKGKVLLFLTSTVPGTEQMCEGNQMCQTQLLSPPQRPTIVLTSPALEGGNRQ